MKYKVQHITNQRKIIRDMNDPEYLTIHSTGNPNSTAQNERDNLNRPGNTTTTGFHVVADDKEAIECIPLNKVAYHAGDGAYGPGNSKSIGLEICESGDRNKTIENAVKVAAKILKEKGWGIDRLRRHHDWSGKNCPRILNYNNWAGWDKFKRDVQGELNGGSNPKPSKPSTTGYQGNSIVDYLNSIKVNSNFNNRKKLANQHGINNYTGTASQNLELLNKLRSGQVVAQPNSSKAKGDMKTGSIVDYLKSINVDSSFANRRKIAREHGINNYVGTANQNTELLKKMRR